MSPQIILAVLPSSCNPIARVIDAGKHIDVRVSPAARRYVAQVPERGLYTGRWMHSVEITPNFCPRSSCRAISQPRLALKSVGRSSNFARRAQPAIPPQSGPLRSCCTWRCRERFGILAAGVRHGVEGRVYALASAAAAVPAL